MGSRYDAQRLHLQSVGTVGYGSHLDGRDPASQTDLLSSEECDASSHHGLKTCIPHKSQTTGVEDAGWGVSEGRCQNGYGSVNVHVSESGSDASPVPMPQLDHPSNSAHRCDLGSNLCLGHRSHPAHSGMGLLRHHQRNAETCCG